MKQHQLIFGLITLVSFSESAFSLEVQSSKKDYCTTQEVNDYMSTVSEFYGAVQAMLDDASFQKYPEFYNALNAAVKMSQDPSQRALSNTIKALFDTIKGAYNKYSSSKTFTDLASGGYERIKSQKDSIETKVDNWKASDCKGNSEWNCYLGEPNTPCAGTQSKRQ